VTFKKKQAEKQGSESAYQTDPDPSISPWIRIRTKISSIRNTAIIYLSQRPMYCTVQLYNKLISLDSAHIRNSDDKEFKWIILLVTWEPLLFYGRYIKKEIKLFWPTDLNSSSGRPSRSLSLVSRIRIFFCFSVSLSSWSRLPALQNGTGNHKERLIAGTRTRYPLLLRKEDRICLRRRTTLELLYLGVCNH